MAVAALAGTATADGTAARPQARLHGAGRALDRGARRRDRPAGGAFGSGARLMRAGGRRAGLRGSGAEARRPRRPDPLVLCAMAPPAYRRPRIAARHGRRARRIGTGTYNLEAVTPTDASASFHPHEM